MGLPVLVCPREKFELPTGEFVEIRGLTRAEALQIRAAMDAGVERVEQLTIAFACEVPEAEATEWWTAAPSDAVEHLVNAIARLSGLDGDAGKAEDGASLSAPSTASTTSSPKPSASP